MRNTEGVISALVLALAACLAMPTRALAVPVEFTYRTTLPIAFISGTNNDDLVVITVVADNGNSSTIGQSWLETDLLWATLAAGSYSARYGAPLLSLNGLAFRTDTSGLLDSANFLGGIAGQNSDSFGVGGGTLLYDDVIVDSVGNFAVLLDPMSGADRLRFWSGPTKMPTDVPEPATLSLLGLGLLMHALVRRRRIGALLTH